MSLSAGQRRQAHLAGLSTDIAESFNYEPQQFTDANLTTKLASGFLTVTNTAYFVYVGQATRDLLAAQIYFFVSVQGAASTAVVQELVIATSDTGPNRASKVLSVKAVASATGDYTAATGAFTNTTAFNYHLPASSHVWLGCRFALTGTPTQPTIPALGLDVGQGAILTTATPGVLAVGSYTGALITQSATLTTAMAPNLILVAS